MKLNKMREEMANAFIEALKQDEIPWKQGWSGYSKPVNAITHSPYKSTNSVWLSFVMDKKGYSDPRWCTFNQAAQKGWRVKSGEKGTKIEFWSMYDKKEKKLIENDEQLNKIKQEPDWDKRIKMIARNFTVFNAEQISGIPELQIKKHDVNLGEFMEKRDTLLTNMNLQFQEGGNSAAYSPINDYIKMPQVEQFENEYEYMSTFLHEAGHATGHESRLGRDMTGTFGSESYAKEELRAEIASAFTAQTIGIKNDFQSSMENHKAYIQNWISILDDKPEELFAAIKAAEQISDYLIEKGEFEPCVELEQPKELSKTNEKKTYYTRDEAENMTQWLKDNIPITDVLQGFGFTIEKVGTNYYTLKEHDSVRIDTEKNCFFWNSMGSTGCVIDSCVAFAGMNKAEAYNHLYSMVGGQESVYEAIYGRGSEPTYTPKKYEVKKTNPEKTKEGLDLPERAAHTKNVYAYLNKTRGISTDVITEFVKKGMLYQDTKNNCVFVSKDAANKPVFACKRGTNTNKRFVADCIGCDYTKGFYVNNGTAKLYVAESVIDIMSKMTMLQLEGKDYHEYNYLALSGTEKQDPIQNVLAEGNINEVVLGLDNDTGGNKARSQIEESLAGKGVEIWNDTPSKDGYDQNDMLKDLLNSNKDKSFKKNTELER